jgi:hypothetical protein
LGVTNSPDLALEGGAARELPQTYGHPDDWDRLIRQIVVWGLAILAFLCGLAAMLAEFSTKHQMEVLAERTSQFGSLISRTNGIDERVAALTTEIRKIEQRETELDAQLNGVDSNAVSISNMSKNAANIQIQIHDQQVVVVDKINIFENKISQLELKLNELEEKVQPSVTSGNMDGGQTVVARETPSPDHRSQSINNFTIVKISGDTAMLAGPQGWFHVEVGTQLPNGAKILEIGRRNNRATVLTDQGAIKGAE